MLGLVSWNIFLTKYFHLPEDYIYEAKRLTSTNGDTSSIFVTWYNVGCITFLEEVDGNDFFLFSIYGHVRDQYDYFEKRRNPFYEVLVSLVSKKIYSLLCQFKHLAINSEAQTWIQFVEKLSELMGFMLILKFDCGLQFLFDLLFEVVPFAQFVDNNHFFTHLFITGVECS